MQRLVGQKAIVPTLRCPSTHPTNVVLARKIQSDVKTTLLQHQSTQHHIKARYSDSNEAIFPIAWKTPTPSPEEIKSSDEKFRNLAKTAEWKSLDAMQIQMMYRLYREQLKRKMETIPIETLQQWANKYIMEGESPPKLRSPLKALFATKSDWEKELTKLADKMLGGENEFKERLKKFEIEMFSDPTHVPIWSDEYDQLSPEYIMENAEFQVLIASMRALESRKEKPLFNDPFAEELVKGSGPLLKKFQRNLEPFSSIHVLEPAQLFTSQDSHPTDVLANYEKLLPESQRDLARDYFAVRTKYFDDFLQEKLLKPDHLYVDNLSKHYSNERQVVILGAGLDTRAFRLQFPERTTVFEIDDEDIMEYKEEVIKKNGWKPNCARRVAIGALPLSDLWEVMLQRVGFKTYIPTIWIAEGSCSKVHTHLVYRGSLISSVGSWCVTEMLYDGNAYNPNVLIHPGQVPFKTKDPKKELSHRGYSLVVADEIGGPAANYGRLPRKSFLQKLFSGGPGYFVYGQKLPVDEASNKMKMLSADQALSDIKKGKYGVGLRPEARKQDTELMYDLYNLEEGGIKKRRSMQKFLRNVYIGTDVGELLSTKDEKFIGQLLDKIYELEADYLERKEKAKNEAMKTPGEKAAEKSEFMQKVYNGFEKIMMETWIEFEEFREKNGRAERNFLKRELESIVAGKVAELFLFPDKYDEKSIDQLIREDAFKEDEDRYFRDVIVRNIWMHVSEGLNRLGVDTKENNESKVYRMIQSVLSPKDKEPDPPKEKTKEQQEFDRIIEEDREKLFEWQEELIERQHMLHETVAEYAQKVLEKTVQVEDPRPVRQKRWIDASDRLLREDIPLDLQKKEKEVMLKLMKYGLSDEDKEIYQKKRDWMQRRRYVFQNDKNTYHIAQVLYDIDKEEQEAKKQGKWRDDAWFMKIHEMVENWQDLGDPNKMPQDEKNFPLPQPYVYKKRNPIDTNLIMAEDIKLGRNVTTWSPVAELRLKMRQKEADKERRKKKKKSRMRKHHKKKKDSVIAGQFDMLRVDPHEKSMPEEWYNMPPSDSLPRYLRWLYQSYRSAMPEPPFRGMVKRVEMTRMLRDRARSYRKVKHLPLKRLEYNPKHILRRKGWKLDPLSKQEKIEWFRERGEWIRSQPKWHKKAPTKSKFFYKANNLLQWEDFDNWKNEYKERVREQQEREQAKKKKDEDEEK